MLASSRRERSADEGDGEEEPAEGIAAPCIGVLPRPRQGIIDGSNTSSALILVLGRGSSRHALISPMILLLILCLALSEVRENMPNGFGGKRTCSVAPRAFSKSLRSVPAPTSPIGGVVGLETLRKTSVPAKTKQNMFPFENLRSSDPSQLSSWMVNPSQSWLRSYSYRHESSSCL